jgi:hypothetical protein
LAMFGGDGVEDPVVAQDKELANVSRCRSIYTLADPDLDHRNPYFPGHLRSSLQHVFLQRPGRSGRS